MVAWQERINCPKLLLHHPVSTVANSIHVRFTKSFVSPWHYGVLCWPPVSVDGVQVAVAHASVGDLDEHILGAQRTPRELVGGQHSTAVTGSPAQGVGVSGALSTADLQEDAMVTSTWHHNPQEQEITLALGKLQLEAMPVCMGQ